MDLKSNETGCTSEIKNLRQKLNMSQSQFGKAFGIPIRTIQGWEQGKSVAPSYIVSAITEACKVRGLLKDEKENKTNMGKNENTPANRYTGMSKKIRDLLSIYGMTQETLAEKLGISRQYLNIRLRHNNWKMSDLEQIADIFGLEFVCFFREK